MKLSEMTYEDLNELTGAFVAISNHFTRITDKVESVNALGVLADLHDDILRVSEPVLKELMSRRQAGERLVTATEQGAASDAETAPRG